MSQLVLANILAGSGNVLAGGDNSGNVNKVTIGSNLTLSGGVLSAIGGGTGSVTSVAVSRSGNALAITGSPITSAGTINIGFSGNSGQYIDGSGNLTTFPSIITQAQNLVTEVYNETGATLTKGTVVYINGGHGNLPTITKAIATGDATSAQTYGVVRADITNMNNGYVTVFGNLDNMDTQAYPAGTQLYLSSTTAGAYTSVKQYAPAHLVYVGIVVRSHPTQGVIEIRIQNGFEMDELHNVSAQTPSNGDILQYVSSTSLWTSVAGTTTNIAEGTNLYFTNTRARGVLSTNVGSALSYNSTTGRFTLVAAESGVDGYLTGADWDYFDSKQASLGTGTTAQFLRGDLVWAAPPTPSLEDLTDVDITSVTNGQVLRWRIDHWENWTLPSALVSSVFGRTGDVVAVSGDYTTDLVTEATNLYYTNARARGSVSVDVGSALTYNSTTGRFSLPAADGGVAGYVTTTDYNYWDSKQDSLGTGTTSQWLRGDLTWSTVPAPSLNDLTNVAITSPSNGQLLRYQAGTWINFTPTYVAPGFFSANAPLSYNSTTGVFSISQATTSTNGYLSSTDWNTFNGKQSQINGTGFVKATGTTISYDNTSYLPLTGGTISGQLNISMGSSAIFAFTVNEQSTFAFGSTNGRRVAIIRNSAVNDNGLQFGYDATDNTGIIAGSADLNGTGIDFYTFNGSVWSNKMRLTKAGLLGVGTNSPTEIIEASNGLARIKITSTTNSNNAGLYFLTKNSSGTNLFGGVYYIPSSTPYLTLSGDNNNGHLNITNSGNVGVNTTNPLSLFHIKSVNNTNAPTLGSGAGPYFLSSANQYYGLYAGVSSDGHSWLQNTRNDGTAAAYPISLNPNGGVVLIGTTTDAGYKLDVSGNGRFTSSLYITGGDLGVGTSTPETYSGYRTAEISATAGGIVFAKSTTGSITTQLVADNGTSSGYVGTRTNHSFSIRTNNSDKLIITSSGAATFSSNLVAINGNGLTEFKINNNTSEWELYMPSGGTDLRLYRGSDKVTFLANGNVGISTTNPGYKLHLSGGNEVGSRFIVTGTYAPLQFSGDGATTLGAINAYSGRIAFGRGTSTGIEPDISINSTYGNIGLGTSSPNTSTTVEIKQPTAGNPTLGTASGNLFLSQNGLWGTFFGLNGSTGNGWIQQMRNDSAVAYNLIFQPVGGNVLIGTYTDGGYKLYISGSVGATGGFFEASDKRLKKELKDNPASVNIENIKPKLYIKNGKEELGYYAQDFLNILPSAVWEGSDGLLSLSYSQVHTAKISKLESELSELKQIVKDLIYELGRDIK